MRLLPIVVLLVCLTPAVLASGAFERESSLIARPGYVHLYSAYVMRGETFHVRAEALDGAARLWVLLRPLYTSAQAACGYVHNGFPGSAAVEISVVATTQGQWGAYVGTDEVSLSDERVPYRYQMSVEGGSPEYAWGPASRFDLETARCRYV